MASPIVEGIDTSFSKIVERLLQSMGARVDANTGSLARMLAEAYAREMATFYEMLELAHESGYLDTAKGGALDNVVALLGIKRARAGRLTGSVEFSRTSPAPDDIGIPVGCRVMSSDTSEAALTFATTTDAVLRRGETRVEVPVQEVDYDPKLASATHVIDRGTLTVMPRSVLGVNAVTNPAPLLRNSVDESDEDLRARARSALRESDKGTSEAIVAAVRREGVRQVTVREPEGGPPGLIEVVVGDRDFGKDPEAVKGVMRAIREAKAAGVRARLSYAKTIYFQPEIEIEPADPNLDEGGFDRLRREIEDAISDFGARLPVGEMIRRRRLEATLFGNPGVRNIGDIKMRTFVRDGEEAGDPRLVPETEDRERDAQRDWLLRPLETAVFDKSVKPPLITRMRPPIFRVALTIAVNTEDRRPTDDVRTAVREALDAYAGWLGKTQTSILKWENLATKLKEKAGVAELRGVTISDTTGLTVKLEPDGPRREYSLRPGARLELGSVEVVRAS